MQNKQSLRKGAESVPKEKLATLDPDEEWLVIKALALLILRGDTWGEACNAGLLINNIAELRIERGDDK